MARRGRPRLGGERAKNGRRILKPAFDHGADHIIALRARFAKYRKDDKAEQQLFDPIGRAWAVGLLENDRIDPAVLRDAGRNYAAAFWVEYPASACVSNYTGDIRRGSWDGQADPRGERFQKLDGLLSHRDSRQAVHELCVDRHWFPDANPAWLDRLIEYRLGKQRFRMSDYDQLFQAIQGLMALAGEKRVAA